MPVLVRRPRTDAGYHWTIVLSKSGGVVRAVDFGGYETRHESVLRLIAAADREHGLPPFGPVAIFTGDHPICRAESWRSLAFVTAPGFTDVPAPDFVFDAWPQVGLDDYERVCVEIAAGGGAAPDRRVVGWIGNCDSHPIRWRLHALARDHPDLLEAVHVSWTPKPGAVRLAATAGNDLTLAEQSRRWAFFIDVEGRGYSARLKVLLHSGRPVFVQDRPWREWWWPALRPMVHYIPVRRDLSDLLERARWALKHPAEAEAIGQAGQAFAREQLTRPAAVRRWAEALREASGARYLPYASPGRVLLGRVMHGLPAPREASGRRAHERLEQRR